MSSSGSEPQKRNRIKRGGAIFDRLDYEMFQILEKGSQTIGDVREGLKTHHQNLQTHLERFVPHWIDQKREGVNVMLTLTSEGQKIFELIKKRF